MVDSLGCIADIEADSKIMKTTNEMTPEDILVYARERLERCEREAANWRKVVEGLIAASGATEHNRSNGEMLPALRVVTADEIKKEVSKRAMRVADLVALFGANEHDIRKVVADPKSGLIIGSRGWIRTGNRE